MFHTKILWMSILFLGCHQLSTAPLPSGDRRQKLVGTWQIEFRLDSIDRQPASDSTARATGTIVFLDSVIQNAPDGLKGTVVLDFMPLLGRQISCYRSGEVVFPISYRGDSVSLSLTPGVADCGLWITGELRGDTMTGRWMEEGFACCPSLGRFVMSKAPVP